MDAGSFVLLQFLARDLSQEDHPGPRRGAEPAHGRATLEGFALDVGDADHHRRRAHGLDRPDRELALCPHDSTIRAIVSIRNTVYMQLMDDDFDHREVARLREELA